MLRVDFVWDIHPPQGATISEPAVRRNVLADFPHWINIRVVEDIDLLPKEWQTCPLVVVPAGYAPAWSVVLAELHGRLGYFPDVVRLRPAPAGDEEPFEVADIMMLREIRSKSRGKR